MANHGITAQGDLFDGPPPDLKLGAEERAKLLDGWRTRCGRSGAPAPEGKTGGDQPTGPTGGDAVLHA